MKNSVAWLLSTAVSFAAIVILLFLWWKMNQYAPEDEPEHSPLTNMEDVEGNLDKWEVRKTDLGITEPTVQLKTGLFVQSVEFFNSSEVHVTGYIWQRYRDGVHDDLKPTKESKDVGFILPDQVETDNEPREAYRDEDGDYTVIGWHFESTLRQPFDYSTYPFDHTTVWIRLWPNEFWKNIVLVPDFDAYSDGTINQPVFGIEESIVLGAWEGERTFFDY